MRTDVDPGRSGIRVHGAPERLTLAGAEVVLHRGLFGGPEADAHLAGLLDEVEWAQQQIAMFGRVHDEPRLTAWYGDPDSRYTYSGITMDPSPWTDRLLVIRAVAEDAAGTTFNSVLLNRYRDGRDSMGWHADDEPELGRTPVIGSVSLGATRRGERELVATAVGTVAVGRTAHPRRCVRRNHDHTSPRARASPCLR